MNKAEKISKNVPEKEKNKKKLSKDEKKKSIVVPAPIPITSLQDMAERIMEKFEENKIEGSPADPESEDKIIIHNDIEESNQVIVEAEKEIEEEHDVPVITPIRDTTNKPLDDKNKIEAVLFAVGKYLEEENISQLCEIDKRHVKKALEELRKEYDSRDGALMIIQEGTSWKINVRERFLSLVRKIVSDTELSKSVMETLSVIAWKTPIYQNEVVKIRGNKCYDHIEELEIAGFITKDKKGRSYVLKTTEKFYNYFDIDQKNLKGVMNEAKIPSKQSTLDTLEPQKSEEEEYTREKLIAKLEGLQTKSVVRTDEDRIAQREFLDDIHHKIERAGHNTDDIASTIPRPMHENDASENQEMQDNKEIPPELEGEAVIEKNEEDIVIDTGDSSTDHHFQKAQEQPQKPKQMTKKQLEKKYKDELQRVKDKGPDKK